MIYLLMKILVFWSEFTKESVYIFINMSPIRDPKPPLESEKCQYFKYMNSKFREGHEFAKFRCTQNLVF